MPEKTPEITTAGGGFHVPEAVHTPGDPGNTPDDPGQPGTTESVPGTKTVVQDLPKKSAEAKKPE